MIPIGMSKAQAEHAIKLLMPIYEKHLAGEMTLEDVQFLYDHAHLVGSTISDNSREMLALHKELSSLMLKLGGLE
jgi:hypothetical protein